MCSLPILVPAIQDHGFRCQRKSHYEIFPEVLDMPEWLDVHHRVMHGESLSSPADEFHRDDGTVQFVRWSMIPWLDRTSGEQIGAISVQ